MSLSGNFPGNLRCMFVYKGINLLATLALFFSSCSTTDRIRVHDEFIPLPAGSVQLNGYLEGYIQHSINHWNGKHVCTWLLKAQ